jgi:enterochelin esterase-like enzyme
VLSLTGTPLFLIAVTAALLPLLGVAWLAIARNTAIRRTSVLTRVLPAVALVVCAQLFAMAALALKVNDEYLFYTSWADLTGQVPQDSPIRTQGLVTHGDGTVRVMTAPSSDTGSQHQILVWLPPQYDLPAYQHHRFPVVMFMPGQPSTPLTVFAQYDFAQRATAAIGIHHVQPFIGVFPTLMVSPPRDTECTNVPGGPKAETWLTTDVPNFVEQRFRVASPGKAWTAMGWSTGGFCAAKLVTSHPASFGSAVSFGGYYRPIPGGRGSSLFAGRRGLEHQNSPEWLYAHHAGLRGARMLLIAGRQDKETWASTSRMIRAAAGDPNVAHISFPLGGHNYRNYSAYLPAALRWSAATWPSAGQP